VSRSAYVADASFLIEQLAQPPVILVGQSLGGQTVLLLAAQRPDLVEALILADAGPGAAGSTEAAEQAANEQGRSLLRWPVPFPDRNAAIVYFGGPSLTAEAWADGLVPDDRGLRPSFDVPVMVETLRQAVSRSYWDEWKSIQCPTLVLRSGRSAGRESEYVRHGAASLIAALDVAIGKVMATGIERNNSVTFTAFLEEIEMSINSDLAIHVVMDNGSSHTTKATKAWLDDHPRFVVHHTPVHASWLNQVSKRASRS
jgi:hypothetical protein